MNATDVMQARLTEQNVFRALTLLVFSIVVGTLLVRTDFLPYVTDNNETFSSILHAKNMYLHGIGSFFGLTNETTSPDPAAQAFLYTHQGNFPRLYALVLYALGARSAELQIALTAFTIGTAGILFAHIYMEERVNPLFAFIFCTVLITDYVMSLQWIVNTWRVWHLFFFFSSLLLAHAFAKRNGSRNRQAIVGGLLFVNFACLFYFELIFAAFVAVFFGFYLAYLLWRQPRMLIAGWAIAALGGIAACVILVLQIVAQLGWDVFVADLRFTFLSRNSTPRDLADFRENVQTFMRDNKLVFWDNFVLARSPFRDPSEVIKLFFHYNLLPLTPLLVLISVMLSAGAGLRLMAKSIQVRLAKRPKWEVSNWLQKRTTHGDAAALLIPLFAVFSFIVVISASSYGIAAPEYYLVTTSRIPVLGAVVLAASAVVLFVCNIYGRLGPAKLPGTLFLSLLVAGAIIHFFISSGPPRISIAVLAVLFAIVLFFIARLWRALLRNALTNIQVGAAVVFLLISSVLAFVHTELYQSKLTPVAPHFFETAWRDFVDSLGGHIVWKTIIIGTAFLGVLMIMGRFDASDRSRSHGLARLGGIVPYTAIGLLAYLVIFMIAPGYIFTAYQNRHCPFAVYLADVLIAAAIYVLCALAVLLIQRFLQAYRSQSAAMPSAAVGAFSSSALLVAVGVAWLSVQIAYVRRLPPDRVAPMFHALKDIAGHSSLVNNYATPTAVQTGTWSYFDPFFFSDGAFFDGGSVQVSSRDYRYLWLADWKTNTAYRTPEYFVCWLQLGFYQMVSKALWTNCGDLGGVRQVREGNNPYFDHEEVARDKNADLWSVIRLDWGKQSPVR